MPLLNLKVWIELFSLFGYECTFPFSFDSYNRDRYTIVQIKKRREERKRGEKERTEREDINIMIIIETIYVKMREENAKMAEFVGGVYGGSNPVVLSGDTALVDGGIVSRNGYVYTTPKGIYSQNEDVYAGHGEIVSRNGDVYSGSNGVVVANGDVFAGSGITYVTVMGLSAKMRKP